MTDVAGASGPEAEPRGGCDLHTHTTASDGRLAPAALVRLAIEVGLQAIAITDHDTLAGLEPARAAAQGLALTVVPGLEVGAEQDGHEVHVLGYFCRGGAALRDLFQGQRLARRQRMRRMIERLRQNGVDVSWSQVEAAAEGEVLTRPHLARALVAAGQASDMADAFRRFLVPGAPGYAPRPHLSPAEAVAAIRADGGVPVLAHPALIGDDGIVADVVAAGLAGIEAWHSDHTPADQQRYAELAARHDLVATGGSDFHGDGRQRSLGGVRVDASVVDALAARSVPA